jgi:hypothetical protein
VAGKRFYFGVGGGTAYLQRLAEERRDEFGLAVSVVQSIEDGLSNVRDILEVRRCP